MLLLLLLAADVSLWATRTENNAVRTREAAAQLAETAGAISRSGRVGQLAPLRSDADELLRRANLLLSQTAREVEPPVIPLR